MLQKGSAELSGREDNILQSSSLQGSYSLDRASR